MSPSQAMSFNAMCNPKLWVSNKNTPYTLLAPVPLLASVQFTGRIRGGHATFFTGRVRGGQLANLKVGQIFL